MNRKTSIRKQVPKTFSDKVDDFIGVFSPFAAARRRYSRFVLQHMFGAYRGAENGRLRGTWTPGGGSADRDLLPELATLRDRSRDLVRNDGIASGAVDTISTNIIGSGIRPQSRLDRETLKISEDYADQLQKKIEKIWERWVPYADAGGRMNFYEIEELVERSRIINGEAIVIPLRLPESDRKRPYSFGLQVVEADRLNTPYDLFSDKNVRLGVQVGAYGEPLAYYIRTNHPGDINYTTKLSGNSINNFIKYPAFNDLGDPNIFHLYHVKRAGQTRGEPFFAPVINLFKDRFEYMEAEIVAARVAACFAVFIKKENASASSIYRSSETADGKRVEELSPAMVEYLNPGESIEPFNPNRPGGTFGLFMERILRDISSGLNIPYEILAKDFSKSNYSNTRAALLEARRFFMMQQRFISDKFGQPVLMALLEEAYLMGELPILDFYQNREAYVRSRWIAPGWQWVDPQNEVQAAVEGVNNNISTLAEETATQGQDWEDTLEQRARELKKIKELEEKYGIKLTPQQAPKVGKPSPAGKKPGQVVSGGQPGEPENQPQPEGN
jgi:lambda family phage portal protein